MKEGIIVINNGELKRKNNTACFVSGKEKKFIPIENLKEIYVLGDVSLNKKFLELLNKHKVIMHFFNFYGSYIGSFYPKEFLNSGCLILKQAEHYLDLNKRLLLARKFVYGALENMKKVLAYYVNRGRRLSSVVQNIELFQKSVQTVNSIEELMALEGNAKNYYYSAFDEIIKSSDFSFIKRTRRPPQNRLNALLSFSYSLLYAVCLTEIYHTHLDPRIGYLHATNFRRFSLNLDIAEIFKPVIADRVVLSVVNKGIIKPRHFEQEINSVTLNEKGKKIFLEEMRKKLASTIHHSRLNRNVSYQHLIRLELYKLEKHLLGEAEYTPFVSNW